MGAYTSIRGWIEVHDKALSDIRSVLTDHEDRASDFGLTREGAELYNQGWVIPDEHINWTHYIFYGADIRTQAVPFIRSQMTQIAAMFMRDPEIDDDWGIFPVGVIHIEEDGTYGHPDEEWQLRDGKLLAEQTQREQAAP
jgi:hypothetical protein